MTSSDWSSVLFAQLWIVPYLIVYLVAMLVAVVRWPRHPMVSLLCLLGFAILMVSLLSGIGLQLWQLSMHEFRGGRGPERVVFNAVLVLRTGMNVLAWVLLLIAMFGWRPMPPVAGKPS